MRHNKVINNNDLRRGRHPFYHGPLILGGLVAICFLSVGFSSSIDLATGLAKAGGKLEVFRAKGERGVSVWIQETDRAIWGYAEWPDKEWYGFFETGTADSGLVQARCQPASAPSLRISFRRESGGVSIRGSFGDDQNGIQEFSATREATPLFLRLGCWSDNVGGTKGASPGGNVRSSFSVVSLVSGDPVVEKSLDRRLRKGRSVVNYARLYWDDFNKRSGATRSSPYPGQYDEKQYALWSGSEVFSCALQRRIAGGGQGKDISRGAGFFSFSTFKVRSGERLSLDDVLAEGWEGALTPLLTREMVRVTAPGRARPESAGGATDAAVKAKAGRTGMAVVVASDGSGAAPADAADLRSRGFFEDSVAPSDEYFFCRSGLGFYYAPYSLAPASKGDFVVVIPWAQLDGLLKKPFSSY